MHFIEVPKQVCMTKDNVNLQLTSVIYYHITSPHKAAFGISNIRQALVERTQTTLRHVVGARVLQDVIERREEIAQSIGEIIEDVASGWGVQVESMLIKDIIFSSELQDSLSMAAQSKRIGESKVIAARAEVESAKLMRQAADILSSAPAMQIRYLEAMQAMAKTANSKVIFLPGSTNVANQMAAAEANGEGPSSYGQDSKSSPNSQPFMSGSNDGFQQAMNARVIENIWDFGNGWLVMSMWYEMRRSGGGIGVSAPGSSDTLFVCAVDWLVGRIPQIVFCGFIHSLIHYVNASLIPKTPHLVYIATLSTID